MIWKHSENKNKKIKLINCYHISQNSPPYLPLLRSLALADCNGPKAISPFKCISRVTENVTKLQSLSLLVLAPICDKKWEKELSSAPCPTSGLCSAGSWGQTRQEESSYTLTLGILKGSMGFRTLKLKGFSPSMPIATEQGISSPSLFYIFRPRCKRDVCSNFNPPTISRKLVAAPLPAKLNPSICHGPGPRLSTIRGGVRWRGKQERLGSRTILGGNFWNYCPSLPWSPLRRWAYSGCSGSRRFVPRTTCQAGDHPSTSRGSRKLSIPAGSKACEIEHSPVKSKQLWGRSWRHPSQYRTTEPCSWLQATVWWTFQVIWLLLLYT